jgi:putative transposase
MLGQLAHVFSLNELVDLSTIFSGELRRIRGIEAVKLTTFSHANRTRSPSVMQKFFRLVYWMFAREDPAFANPRHKGALAKFRMRGIYAVDSTTIQLAYWCIKWAKLHQRKAAVKLHMVANVANILPRFAVVGKASEHDSKREEELFAPLPLGDVGIFDREYNNFPVLYQQTLRGVFFVIRKKEHTKYRVVKRVARKNLPKGIISDETIRLAGTTTKANYPRTLRRVKALVEVKGEMREMVFYTNNFEWSASTVAGLYKARWAIELLFKELKQTLQLQSFFGENQNAVE